MFASSFLYGVNQNMPIDQAQIYAHATASELIKSENEKI